MSWIERSSHAALLDQQRCLMPCLFTLSDTVLLLLCKIPSLLLGLACLCFDTNLGLENELPTVFLHTPIGLVLCDCQHPTKWTLFHSVLDSVLWPGVSLLGSTFRQALEMQPAL